MADDSASADDGMSGQPVSPGMSGQPAEPPTFPSVMPYEPPKLPDSDRPSYAAPVASAAFPAPSSAAPVEPERALEEPVVRSVQAEEPGPPPVLAAPTEEPAIATTTDDSAPLAAAGTSRRERKKDRKHGSFLRELPVLLVIAFGLALLIKAFLIQAFFIPSGSMENTLQVRDRVLVNKLVYRFRDIHRGEIVVFNGLDSFTPETVVPPPANAFDSARRKVLQALGLGTPGEKDFIKRVIGIPGDTVACCDDGRVTINGEPIDEPYVFENDEREFGPEVVPEGKLFVMGDHRGASDDSRAKGTVPADKVIGRAFVVIWPPGNFTGLKVPPELEGRKGALGAADPPVPTAPWSVAALPPVLGMAGAVPLHLAQRAMRRRWRHRRRQAA